MFKYEIKELQLFIQRFSANKSKSKQATARRKLLEKITLEEIPASSRRYPWVAFSPDREVGKDILFVTDVSKTVDGVKLLDHVSFTVNHGDKIAFVGEDEIATTTSNFALTGISSSSRPLICAQPVNPGVTSFAPYLSRSATRSS